MTRLSRVPRAAALIAVSGMSVAALAACSGGATPESTDSAPPADGPVTIEYVHRLPDGEGMTAVNDIVKKWNDENPNIQVKATKFDGAASDLQLKLETDVNAGVAPCLAQVGYAEVPNLYVKGLLADVTAEAEKYKGNFSAGAYSAMGVGETTVGLPQDVGPLVYFYNEAEFAKLGIEVPATIADLTADSATAAASGKYLTAFTPDEALHWLSAQAASAGDTWYSASNDQWNVTANGPGAQKVASFWQDLIDNKQTLTTERWGDGFTAALNDSSLIGHIGAAWEAGFLLDSLDGTEAEGQWRVAQLPDFGAGQVSGPDGGSGVAVMKGCEYLAQAMEFNNWFNTQVDELATQGLVVAATTSVPATPEKMLRQFGDQDVMTELLTASANLNENFPYAPGFSTLTSLSKTASEVVSGDKKVSDIFTDAQASSIKALKDLGLPVAE